MLTFSPHQSLLTSTTSHILALLFASAYVGSLYISKNARLSFSDNAKVTVEGVPRAKLSNERWRDDPDVIKARLAAVFVATLVCCVGVFGVVRGCLGEKDAVKITATRLGFVTGFDWEALRPHLITPILFFGPLYVDFLRKQLPFQAYWRFESDFVEKFCSWQGLRNYSLAPITEEIVFRACVLSVYHLSDSSKNKMIFLGPLVFGLAHVHHAWDTYNRYGRNVAAAKRAVITSIIQLAYTTLFGFHCSYLFLRTGSILPAITAHIFCNIMGLPAITWELKQFPKQKRAILLTYILGVVGYVYTLRRWSHTSASLYWSASTLA